MKFIKKYGFTAILAALALQVGASASAADLTVWRTAAMGDVIGNGKFFNTTQMFVGRSTSSVICGATVPCNVVLSATADTSLSATPSASFMGTINVVDSDPIFGGLLLPNNIKATLQVSGDLNLVTETATGRIVLAGGRNVNFTANLTGNQMVIYEPPANPVLSGGVLRFDMTLQ